MDQRRLSIGIVSELVEYASQRFDPMFTTERQFRSLKTMTKFHYYQELNEDSRREVPVTRI